jgi:hypothetical protein
LAKSKSSQADAVTVVIPCADMPTACAALEAWANVARLEPGQPVFRPVDQRQSSAWRALRIAVSRAL